MTFNEIIQSDKPVLVDFFAAWCGPCKIMAPVLKEVKAAVGDKAIILKVDVDKSPEAASKFGVQGVPTFIIFRKGEQVWRKSGVIPKENLMKLIESFTA